MISQFSRRIRPHSGSMQADIDVQQDVQGQAFASQLPVERVNCVPIVHDGRQGRGGGPKTDQPGDLLRRRQRAGDENALSS